MADLQTIRQALAGSLATLRPDTLGQVSAYLLDNPTPPSGMVAAVDDFELLDFGATPSVQWTILIEVVLGKTSDIGSQKLLNELLAPTGATSLVAAIEGNNTLTSRLSDSGVLTTGQASAGSVAFSEFRGQNRLTLENGSTVLLAVWAFEVIS